MTLVARHLRLGDIHSLHEQSRREATRDTEVNQEVTKIRQAKQRLDGTVSNALVPGGLVF